MRRILISAALAVLAIGLLTLAQSRSATAIEPGKYLIDDGGKISCQTLYTETVLSPAGADLTELGPLFGFKYDASPTGYLSHTLTNDSPWIVTDGPEDPYNWVEIFNVLVNGDGEGIQFDWSASLGIDAVIVKAQDSNAYVYVPEAFGGTGLQAPGDKAVSHVEFCYDYELEAEKTATGTFDQETDWTITKDYSGDYDLLAGQSETHGYEVSVTKSVTMTNPRIIGTITISNSAPFSAEVDVSDVITDATETISAAVTCPSGTDTDTVPAATASGPGVLTCSYLADEDNGVDGDEELNTATVDVVDAAYEIAGATTTADITFSSTNTGEPDAITVIDDHDNDAYDLTWSDVTTSTTWSYSATFTCSTDPEDYTDGTYTIVENNTATIDETGESDIETVTVDCYAPILDKDASASYDERHDWGVEKTVDPDSQSAFAGNSVGWTWTISITETVVNENFAVTGNIDVTNPVGSSGDMTVDLVDELNDGTTATVDCGGGATSVTVAPGATETCSYSASPPDASATLNTATGTFNNIDFTDTADVTFVRNLVNDSATLSDTEIGLTDQSVSGGDQFTANDSDVCSSDQADYGDDGQYDVTLSNTAILVDEEGNQYQSTATSTYTCYAPTVEKDATAEWEQSYDWTITKTVDPEIHSGSPGDQFTSAYTVTVDRTFTETVQATGTISVTNPAGAPDAITVDVADAVGPYVATVDCDGSGGTSLTVAAGETGTCSYTVDLPDNETRTNTATVTFNDMDFTATEDVVFDEPIVHGYPTINVTDYFDGDQGGDPLGSASDDFTFRYSRDFECPTNEDVYTEGMYTDTFPNFAEIDETGQQDDANVDLTCTVEPVGRIIVDKVTDPSGAEQLFTFNPSWGPSFELADEDPPYDSGPLSPGTYFVTETVPAGWELDSAVCASSNPEDQETPGSISLQAGETVRCTFTNVGEPAYTFQKLVNGEDADTLEEAVSVEAGDTLTFTYMLTNTGNITVTWTALTDDVFGDLTEECELPVDVPVGETSSCDILRPAQEREQGQQNIGTASVEGLDDQTDPAWYRTSAPTPVELLYFRAQGTGSAIRLEWGVAAEIDMSGYYLYRAKSSQFGLAQRLGFQVAEGSYTTYDYVDKDVEPGKTYWYWLVSIETNGTREREGPVQASMVASAPGNGFQIYLPFVARGH